jgi:hypothetical protein
MNSVEATHQRQMGAAWIIGSLTHPLIQRMKQKARRFLFGEHGEPFRTVNVTKANGGSPPPNDANTSRPIGSVRCLTNRPPANIPTGALPLLPSASANIGPRKNQWTVRIRTIRTIGSRAIVEKSGQRRQSR